MSVHTGQALPETVFAGYCAEGKRGQHFTWVVGVRFVKITNMAKSGWTKIVDML